MSKTAKNNHDNLWLWEFSPKIYLTVRFNQYIKYSRSQKQ